MLAVFTLLTDWKNIVILKLNAKSEKSFPLKGSCSVRYAASSNDADSDADAFDDDDDEVAIS